jgi:hypothetical protein
MDCFASLIESIGRGVLDAPPEPVIGLAEGETRWRGMTVLRAATIRIACGIRGRK